MSDLSGIAGVKEQFELALPDLVTHAANKALESDDPKDALKVAEMGLKLLGAFPKENSAPNLPTFHITIGANGAVRTAKIEEGVVDVEATEVQNVPVDPVRTEEIERSLSIFDLNFQPIE